MIDYPVEDFPIVTDVSEVTTPAGSRVALITLSNGDERRPETMGPLGLSRLDDALHEVHADGGFAALIITGSGRTFCAGANLDMLSSPPNIEAALGLAREGHRVFGRLANFGMPTVAAINGTALGGGLELALHCSHRVATANAGPLGLPEIGLGLVPGWGGATLLPSLIGLDTALTVMVDNAIAGKTLTATNAATLGIIDALVDDAVSGALTFIDELPNFTREAPTPVADPDVLVDSRLSRFETRVGNPVHALAQLRTVLLRSDESVAAGFDREDQALSTLMVTAEFRRRLYAFRVTSAASKVPAGTPDVTPRQLERVGVVGAGLMASQIIMLFADTLGVPVVFTDVSQERLDAAVQRVDEWLSARVAKGNLASEDHARVLGLLNPALSTDAFAECDLVIEAVFEDLAVKRDVLTDLEDVVSTDAILASNTSSLSIDTMASFIRTPDRVAGIHFFNPVASMKLVEIVRGSSESDVTLATAVDVARRLRKTPVLVADRPGFVVNRLLSTFLGETMRLAESGVTPDDISRALRPLRLPMSPFQLIDLIGRRVSHAMMESLRASAPERFFVGDVLSELTTTPNEQTIAADISARNIPARVLSDAEIHDYVVDALAREVRVMMREGVTASVNDIDLCMINGAGWPAAIGGLTPYLDGCGASARSTGELFHPATAFD